MILTIQGALEKLPSSGSASLEHQGIVKRLYLLRDKPHQVVDEFGDVLRSIDDIKFTIRKVTPTLKELKQELSKREA